MAALNSNGLTLRHVTIGATDLHPSDEILILDPSSTGAGVLMPVEFGAQVGRVIHLVNLADNQALLQALDNQFFDNVQVLIIPGHTSVSLVSTGTKWYTF